MPKAIMELLGSVLICTLMALTCGAQEAAAPALNATGEHAGGVKSLEKRVLQLEEAMGREVTGDKWYDRLQLSGVIEVEAVYSTVDYARPTGEDEETSTIDLATVELAVDIKIAPHVDGHVLSKWEADEVFVDEGFIALTGTQTVPAYLVAGRQYLPFGNFESRFISDPGTLTLAETNTGAIIGGYRLNGEMIDVSVGAFNGRVKQTGSDDEVANFVAAVVTRFGENLLCGVAYTSNLAAADAPAEFVTDVDGNGQSNDIERFVGGWSAFVSATLLERFRLIGEYIGAAEAFEAGALYDAGDMHQRKPRAWNVELVWALSAAVEIAARYEGSDDGGDATSGVFLLPEARYGAVVNWRLFDHTNLALEYLHAEFEGDVQKTDTVTAQLAVEF